ncbi:TRAP transporter substrate-binding protein DctP [Alkalihalobacillus sp. AL-G]|uniref:TRAP transporter substrate-binding protein DctP n=1 Tax=Alkalihalobacillus sp. AL-G TaxID=2926399 RepID=UPI00272DA0D1|nr:TRAP transporter substrate-binding protein DctP [Alkalihalobacillus sp. AL-G]WLD94538.1 TRAP transporter substrate-binding protein DctP [Alkalihalobacillus sp. AL-G]
MNLNKWFKGLIVLFVILSITACSSNTPTDGNSSDESGVSERTFTFATTNDDSGIDAKIKEKFGELVSEKSNGKMTVDFFMGGQLGGEKEALEQMKLGELDMGYNIVHADLYFEEYNIAMLPYFFSDFESIERFMEGPIGDKIKEATREEGGVVQLGIHSNGPRWTTSNRAFSTPEEMEGLKIRMPEIPWWVEVYKSMGALPTPIAATEIVTALKTGTVDAQENFLSNIAGRRMWEYQKYLMPTKHLDAFQYWLMSEKTWESLNEEEQRIIKESVKETTEYVKTIVEEMNQKFVETSIENGLELVEVDREAFIEAAREANKKIIERDLAPGVYEAAIKAIENK